MKAKQKGMAARITREAIRMHETYVELYAEGIQLIKQIAATNPSPEQVTELDIKRVKVMETIPEMRIPDEALIEEYGEKLAALIVRCDWLQASLDAMAQVNQIFKEYLTPRYPVSGDKSIPEAMERVSGLTPAAWACGLMKALDLWHMDPERLRGSLEKKHGVEISGSPRDFVFKHNRKEAIKLYFEIMKSVLLV